MLFMSFLKISEILAYFSEYIQMEIRGISDAIQMGFKGFSDGFQGDFQ